MRIKYSKRDLAKTYEKIVSCAEKSFLNQDYSSGIDLIRCAAEYQYNVNLQLTDKRLDKLIANLSDRLTECSKNFQSVKNNVILYDSFAWDNRGLTQQYLDALCSCKQYNIMLLHNTCFGENSKYTLEFCRQHKVIVKELGDGSYEERESRLIEIIQNHKPEKVLFHLYPSDILPIATFYAFKQITSYQINLTDHAFWLGASLIDYSLEFRNWGAAISVNDRFIDKQRLLLSPYYPWQEPIPFQGFPVDVKDNIVLFSGGSFYKTEGGDGQFYEIVKRVLTNNKHVVFLMAGDGNRSVPEKFIKENHFEDRVFLLGNRIDIDQVFKHIDIYLNTYPLIGGLMSQFAAINSKPILTYRNKDVESLLCIKNSCQLVIDDIDELCDEADRLVNDQDYRREKGDLMRSLILDKYEFRENFHKVFDTNISQYPIDASNVKYDLSDIYIKRINNGDIKYNLERLVFGRIPTALSWKMWLNIIGKAIINRLPTTTFKNIKFRIMNT